MFFDGLREEFDQLKVIAVMLGYEVKEVDERIEIVKKKMGEIGFSIKIPVIERATFFLQIREYVSSESFKQKKSMPFINDIKDKREVLEYIKKYLIDL